MAKKLHLIAIVLLGLMLSPLSAGAATIVPDKDNIIYVNAAVKTSGDGSSWTHATASLTEALEYANANYEEGLTILVAEGTYYPELDENITTDGTTPTTNLRDRTFLITSNVTIRGGYKADGSGDWDPAAYPTILSGDLDKNEGLSDDDAFHVVLAVGTEAKHIAPTLEGLTITGGYANGNGSTKVSDSPIWRTSGGGLYNLYANTHLHQVVITGNLVDQAGGGIYNYYSDLTLTSVEITANQADNSGGGIYNEGGSATLTQVTVAGNQAGASGGGIYYVGSSLTLTSVVITGNQAGVSGGGIANDGGSLSLTQVTVAGNKAGVIGGGIYNYGDLTLKNSVVWGNTTVQESNSDNVRNDGDTPTFAYSLVQGITTADANGNLDSETTDPGFVAPIDPTTATWPTSAGDYRLRSTSPLIGMGSNALYPGSDKGFNLATDLDLAGNPRLDGTTIDIGAYERVTPVPSDDNALYVNPAVTPGGNGSSWSSPLKSLSDALIFTNARAKADDDTEYTILVAQGTYYPESTEGIMKGGYIGDTEPGLRDRTFLITADVTIRGGYKADGSGKWDPAAYPTILSGDLDKSGGLSDDDAYHVVLAVGTSNTERIAPTLEGLTITGGYANGNGSTKVSDSPIWRTSGGGLYNLFANTHLHQVVITANQAASGGGIYNYDSDTELTSVVISGNQAGEGGGIYNKGGSPTLTQVTVAGNKARDNAGGIASINCIFTLQNSVVWGNTAPMGANVQTIGSTPTYAYCLVQGIKIEDDQNNTGNLDGIVISDPGFVAPINPAKTANWKPTSAGDYRLTATSPLIDKGNNALYPGSDKGFNLATDLDAAGNPRLRGSAIDIGAYEYQSADAPATVYYSYTLEVGPSIRLYNLTAGTHSIAEGDHLFLQFLPEDATLTADDVMLLIDGVDTPFNVPAAGMYYSYILPITGEHTVLIAQREYTVTLPATEGITYNVGAGTHTVAYGERFAFTITGDFAPDQLHVYANGQEISPSNSPEGEALRSEAREGTSSLSYIIDAVTGPITVTLEGTTTANASLTHGIRVVVESGKLKVENETANAVDVTVYTLTGKTFVQLRELRGSKTITLPAGIYIVRAGEQRWKVMVND
ncbi:right-handed parallel beta-helix repeat-containing protein [Parabacteroides sp. PF5-6]|uniref:right-handed parallel beta-helix repeat-containing protein n=1 Tax=Parabacteroides sp. PF5-6 TaxID=1742403 RepID=UPI002406AD9E|nr:right-handed parallel beta-helix repeat-containing protein [Parabacteroides sp. PF5-6]MDF9828901.1 hypothetical protein [Parabacteroides sp. PF5-6]